jgi:hypothetical protein
MSLCGSKPLRPVSVQCRDAAPRRRSVMRLCAQLCGEAGHLVGALGAACKWAGHQLRSCREPAGEVGVPVRLRGDPHDGRVDCHLGVRGGRVRAKQGATTSRYRVLLHHGQTLRWYLRNLSACGARERLPAEWPVRLGSQSRPRLQQVGHKEHTSGRANSPVPFIMSRKENLRSDLRAAAQCCS